jgi:hypothetical protein
VPLEIRELHIKVNVSEPAPGSGAGGQGPRGEQEPGEERDLLISQCVDEVMQLLRNRKER